VPAVRPGAAGGRPGEPAARRAVSRVPPVATYLDAILAAHRALVAADDRDLEWLREQAAAAPPTRGFRHAIVEADGLAVIAEIKRRSPSKGDLHADLDPAEVATAYVTGG